MKIAYEIISVIFWQRHKSATHDNELHLLYTVAQALQLVDAVARLQVRRVPRPYRPHGCGLVPCVGLCAVLEVTVRPSWAIYTYPKPSKLFLKITPIFFSRLDTFPVIAMCGHRCGLHITATTAICSRDVSSCDVMTYRI